MEADYVAWSKEFSSFAGFGNHTQPTPPQPNTVYELWPGVGRSATLALDDAVSRNGPAETALEHQDKAPPRDGEYLLDLCLSARSVARSTHALIIPSFPTGSIIGRLSFALDLMVHRSKAEPPLSPTCSLICPV